jgi:hypothetical protein
MEFYADDVPPGKDPARYEAKEGQLESRSKRMRERRRRRSRRQARDDDARLDWLLP